MFPTFHFPAREETDHSMPKRKRSRSKRPRRRMRRKLPRKLKLRRAHKKSRLRIVRFNRLVASKVITPLVYCDTKTLAPGATAARHKFKINGINDPDYSGVGHQPMFHDNWATLYSKWRVVGFKYHVKFYPTRAAGDITDLITSVAGSADSYPVHVPQTNRDRHIYFMEANNTTDDFFTESGDLNALRELGRTPDSNTQKWRLANGHCTLSGRINLRRLFTDVSHYNTTTSWFSNVTNLLLISFGAMSADGADTNGVRFDVRLTYFVECSDPKDIDQN